MTNQDRFYPPIDEKILSSLKVAKRLASEDAGYLTDEMCPYSAELKGFLANKDLGEGEGAEGDTKPVDPLNEVEGLYQSLKDYGDTIKVSGDPSDKNTFFRVGASLLEKLIALKERAVGVKNTAEFTQAVLDILEDELDADRRTSVIARLKGILSK